MGVFGPDSGSGVSLKFEVRKSPMRKRSGRPDVRMTMIFPQCFEVTHYPRLWSSTEAIPRTRLTPLLREVIGAVYDRAFFLFSWATWQALWILVRSQQTNGYDLA